MVTGHTTLMCMNITNLHMYKIVDKFEVFEQKYQALVYESCMIELGYGRCCVGAVFFGGGEGGSVLSGRCCWC